MNSERSRVRRTLLSAALELDFAPVGSARKWPSYASFPADTTQTEAAPSRVFRGLGIAAADPREFLTTTRKLFHSLIV